LQRGRDVCHVWWPHDELEPKKQGCKHYHRFFGKASDDSTKDHSRYSDRCFVKLCCCWRDLCWHWKGGSGRYALQAIRQPWPYIIRPNQRWPASLVLWWARHRSVSTHRSEQDRHHSPAILLCHAILGSIS
jgi:hypothetical protein